MKHHGIAGLKLYLAPLLLLVLASGCATSPRGPVAAGDYAVPTVDRREAAQAIAKVSKYEFGDSRVPLAEVEDMVRRSLQSPDSRARLAAMLGEVLEGNATVDGKRFACRQLTLIGTEAQVGQLAPLLGDDALRDLARYALERIPGKEVDEALAAALNTTSGPARIGIINSLAARGVSSTRAQLQALRNDDDPATAEAARVALLSF